MTHEEYIKEMHKDYVVCNKKDTCKHAHMCGGAQPHSLSSCEKCPFDDDAVCVKANNQ